MSRFVIASAHAWNKSAFDRNVSRWLGNWTYIADHEELTIDRLDAINPEIIFFPHWSWHIPRAIYERYECIGFHATPLPYGRGGSPIQNMIARGHTETMLSAFRIVGELDAGPIYMQRPLSLIGGAEEIFLRIAAAVTEMIPEIVKLRPNPIPQTGDPVTFARRTPNQSALPQDELDRVFDHIRMLDADGYPRAFLEFGSMKIEFRNAVRRANAVEAIVTITDRHDD